MIGVDDLVEGVAVDGAGGVGGTEPIVIAIVVVVEVVGGGVDDAVDLAAVDGTGRAVHKLILGGGFDARE